MLAEHGMAARGYKDVRANTVPAFALGDYEWILAFEAPELHRIVDLMRDLRATDARRHVARGDAVLHRPARRAWKSWSTSSRNCAGGRTPSCLRQRPDRTSCSTR